LFRRSQGGSQLAHALLQPIVLRARRYRAHQSPVPRPLLALVSLRFERIRRHRRVSRAKLPSLLASPIEPVPIAVFARLGARARARAQDVRRRAFRDALARERSIARFHARAVRFDRASRPSRDVVAVKVPANFPSPVVARRRRRHRVRVASARARRRLASARAGRVERSRSRLRRVRARAPRRALDGRRRVIRRPSPVARRPGVAASRRRARGDGRRTATGTRLDRTWRSEHPLCARISKKNRRVANDKKTPTSRAFQTRRATASDVRLFGRPALDRARDAIATRGRRSRRRGRRRRRRRRCARASRRRRWARRARRTRRARRRRARARARLQNARARAEPTVAVARS